MENTPESPNNRNLRLHDAGIDFYALGNEPFWSLNMDFDRIYRFSTPEGITFSAPPVEPDLAQDAPVRRYRVVTESGEMIVNLQEGDCADTMSDETFSHSVRVLLKRGKDRDYTEYRGCGRYVIPPALHDIFVLREWKGEPVDARSQERGAPVLEFHTGDRRVMGHTGCNRIKGSFSLMGPRTIQFGPWVSTRMACPDLTLENEMQQTFSERRLDFRRDGLQLIFSQRGEDIAVFQKVD